MASTVIVGSGIIGIATAYYLSKHQPGSSIHLVDSSTTLFASASGYAGGFLARDWFHQDLASLGALSFNEHENLAEQFNGRENWLYSKSVTVNYELPRRKSKSSGGHDWIREGASRMDVVEERRDIKDKNSPPWLRRIKGDSLSLVDNGEGTAVLDPLRLCQFLLERCRASGVRIHNPAVVLNVGADCHDELSYVRIGYTDCSSETHLPATRLLVCAGAWTPSVLESIFPGSSINIPVMSLAGHSLVVQNPGDMGDEFHSVYTSTETFSPEIYARPNGHIWLGGVNSSIALPPLATSAKPIDASLEKLKDLAKHLIETEGDKLEIQPQKRSKPAHYGAHDVTKSIEPVNPDTNSMEIDAPNEPFWDSETCSRPKEVLMFESSTWYPGDMHRSPEEFRFAYYDRWFTPLLKCQEYTPEGLTLHHVTEDGIAGLTDNINSMWPQEPFQQIYLNQIAMRTVLAIGTILVFPTSQSINRISEMLKAFFGHEKTLWPILRAKVMIFNDVGLPKASILNCWEASRLAHGETAEIHDHMLK
ncbi:hypothetical protein F53441_10193 [Fusarium austroafricanum]|uniref:FAD dependent oxidoreductase domain-containing protein n=1 Tax=Fusarium austroafricanum TaxID=2364996 RepID=A0A8H4NSI8_9HYPO|nr:hypothetical protein F53441_10193 [Fusarium austroafricanum]